MATVSGNGKPPIIDTRLTDGDFTTGYVAASETENASLVATLDLYNPAAIRYLKAHGYSTDSLSGYCYWESSWDGVDWTVRADLGTMNNVGGEPNTVIDLGVAGVIARLWRLSIMSQEDGSPSVASLYEFWVEDTLGRRIAEPYAPKPNAVKTRLIFPDENTETGGLA